MTTVLQTKGPGFNQIANTINRLCSGNISRFRASIIADMWTENNLNCGAGEISASVHKPQFGGSSLILKIRRPNSSSHTAPGRNKMTVFSESREISMTPEYIIIDESKRPTRIDFYATDLSDLPPELYLRYQKFYCSGDNAPLCVPHREKKELLDAIQKLVPKVYTSIECALQG